MAGKSSGKNDLLKRHLCPALDFVVLLCAGNYNVVDRKEEKEMKKILLTSLAFALNLAPLAADVVDPISEGKGVIYVIVAAVAAIIGGLFLKRKK